MDYKDWLIKNWAAVLICGVCVITTLVVVLFAKDQILPYEEACRSYYKTILDSCSCPALEPLVFP